jgi:hypothetical protein
MSALAANPSRSQAAGPDERFRAPGVLLTLDDCAIPRVIMHGRGALVIDEASIEPGMSGSPILTSDGKAIRRQHQHQWCLSHASPAQLVSGEIFAKSASNARLPFGADAPKETGAAKAQGDNPGDVCPVCSVRIAP